MTRRSSVVLVGLVAVLVCGVRTENCPTGSTGENCVSTSSHDNGKKPCDGIVCPEGQMCQDNVIRCIKAPCPEQPGCVSIPQSENPCSTVLCPPDTVCKVREIYCIAAPCLPPQAVCEPKICEYGDPLMIEYTGKPVICGSGTDVTCPAPYQCKKSLGGETKDNGQKVCCPPRKTVECPKFKCKACKSGYYKYDKNGCQTCDCGENPCSNHHCKGDEACVLKQVQCFTTPCPPIPTCQHICPLPFCTNTNCTNYKYNEYGCMTCECLDDPCKNVQCGPFERCELVDVQCIKAPCPPLPMCVRECPQVRCSTICRHYKYDEYGCQTCQCDDPCATVDCRCGNTCVVEEVPCKKPPCPLQARCVPV